MFTYRLVTLLVKIFFFFSQARDFYKLAASRSTSKTRQPLGSYGFPLLGQISHGSCHAQAILFKVLADAVKLKSKLVKVSTG